MQFSKMLHHGKEDVKLCEAMIDSSISQSVTDIPSEIGAQAETDRQTAASVALPHSFDNGEWHPTLQKQAGGQPN